MARTARPLQEGQGGAHSLLESPHKAQMDGHPERGATLQPCVAGVGEEDGPGYTEGQERAGPTAEQGTGEGGFDEELLDLLSWIAEEGEEQGPSRKGCPLPLVCRRGHSGRAGGQWWGWGWGWGGQRRRKCPLRGALRATLRFSRSGRRRGQWQLLMVYPRSPWRGRGGGSRSAARGSGSRSQSVLRALPRGMGRCESRWRGHRNGSWGRASGGRRGVSWGEAVGREQCTGAGCASHSSG